MIFFWRSNIASKNVKVFYYEEQKVDTRYYVVGDQGSGTLSSYQDLNVPVLTGSPAGSVPTAGTNYRFVGWYTGTYDADTGTVTLDDQLTDPAWIDSETNKLTPQQQDVVIGDTTYAMYVAASYFAKFEPDITTVTVHKQVTGNFGDKTKAFTFQYKLSEDSPWSDDHTLAHDQSFEIFFKQKTAY